ncbi:MAG: hypothetical protein ACO24D_18450 [bacterium]
MNHIQVLHHLERRHVHPVGDFNRHDAVRKTLLAPICIRDQSAISQRLSNALRRLERLNAAVDRLIGSRR